MKIKSDLIQYLFTAKEPGREECFILCFTVPNVFQIFHRKGAKTQLIDFSIVFYCVYCGSNSQVKISFPGFSQAVHTNHAVLPAYLLRAARWSSNHYTQSDPALS
jgi:hypothetical protein